MQQEKRRERFPLVIDNLCFCVSDSAVTPKFVVRTDSIQPLSTAIMVRTRRLRKRLSYSIRASDTPASSHKRSVSYPYVFQLAKMTVRGRCGISITTDDIFQDNIQLNIYDGATVKISVRREMHIRLYLGRSSTLRVYGVVGSVRICRGVSTSVLDLSHGSIARSVDGLPEYTGIYRVNGVKTYHHSYEAPSSFFRDKIVSQFLV